MLNWLKTNRINNWILSVTFWFIVILALYFLIWYSLRFFFTHSPVGRIAHRNYYTLYVLIVPALPILFSIAVIFANSPIVSLFFLIALFFSSVLLLFSLQINNKFIRTSRTFIFSNIYEIVQNIIKKNRPSGYIFVITGSILFLDLVAVQEEMKPWTNSGILFFVITLICYLYNNSMIMKKHIDYIHLLPIKGQLQKWYFSVNDNPTSSNKTSETEPNKGSNNENKKKTSSSWRTFLFLRLTIFFGLLLFLFCSFLLTQSFNVTKAYKQVIIFINDEHVWANSLLIFRTCWSTYIRIWGFRQWAFSLIALIIGYWYLFDVLYHIGLLEEKFTAKQKLFFISTDLFLNFIVGLAYMPHSETYIGGLMQDCPVALSPYFIVAEIIFFLLYRAWLKYRTKK